MTTPTAFILLTTTGVIGIVIWVMYQRRIGRSIKAREQAAAKQRRVEEEIQCLKALITDPQENASQLADATTSAKEPDSSHHAGFRGDEAPITALTLLLPDAVPPQVERATDANPDQELAIHTESLPLTTTSPPDDKRPGPREDNEDVELGHDSVTPLEPPNLQWSTGPRRIAPIDRGGRPRESVSDSTHRVTVSSQIEQSLRPEIVCWKQDRQWVVGVELPETYLTYADLEVNQNDASLVQDDHRRELWWLEQADGQVHICWSEGEIQV